MSLGLLKCRNRFLSLAWPNSKILLRPNYFHYVKLQMLIGDILQSRLAQEVMLCVLWLRLFCNLCFYSRISGSPHPSAIFIIRNSEEVHLLISNSFQRCPVSKKLIFLRPRCSQI